MTCSVHFLFKYSFLDLLLNKILIFDDDVCIPSSDNLAYLDLKVVINSIALAPLWWVAYPKVVRNFANID